MTQEEDVCRFCLDPRNTKLDPLITPCECKGSIRYVHTLCLRHWRLLNPTRNGFICLLCFTPYVLNNDDILEVIPDEGSLHILLLRYPFFLFCLLNYFAVMHYSILPMKMQTVSIFELYEYLFQIVFFLLFVGNWRVKNKRKYVRFFVTKGLLTSLILQIISNMYIYQQYYITGTVLLNFTMVFYWAHHTRALERINSR